MRAALVALGSRGDTQPCVALAGGLAARGHEVRVVAPDRYEPLVAAEGGAAGAIEHRTLGVDPMELIASAEGQRMASSGPISFVRSMRELVEPIAQQALGHIADAVADVDVVLAPTMGGAGRHMADKFGIKHMLLEFQPSEPTGEFANPLLGGRQLGRMLNRGSFRAVETVSEVLLGSMIDRTRRQVLGLAPARGTIHRDRREGVPVLCGVSDAVQPRPADWPVNVQLTGFWHTAARRPLAPEIERFLAAGEAPVYVGFGSMRPPRLRELAETVVRAARQAGRRLIVQSLPVDGLGAADEVLCVEDVDHAELFPRLQVVVHHGGAGTTAASLRSGVPTVVCPVLSDQPYWGARVHALGAGPSPLPVSDLTTAVLARRLRHAATDLEMRRRAAQLGRRLRAEDGVGRACDLIEEHVEGRRSVRPQLADEPLR